MFNMESFFSSKGTTRRCANMNRVEAESKEKGQEADPRGKVIQVESRWRENVWVGLLSEVCSPVDLGSLL